MLHEQAEELRDIERQIDRTVVAKDRTVLERMRQQTAVSALSTFVRFAVFSASIADQSALAWGRAIAALRFRTNLTFEDEQPVGGRGRLDDK